MRQHDRFVLSLVTLCLALAIAPALAGEPTPGVAELPKGTTPRLVGLATLSPTACTAGQPVAVWQHAPLFLPPNDRYYTFIDPAACGGAVNLTAAHWVLYWPNPCQIPIQITLVGATETSPGSGCYVPNDADVIGSAISTSLNGTAGGQINHTYSVSWPLLIRKAFLSFNMLTSGNCPTDPPSGALASPRAISDGSPDHCVTYNTFPGQSTPLDMVAPPFNYIGNLTMWVDTDGASVGADGRGATQFALGSVTRSPARSELQVSFSLANSKAAVLALYDVGGRQLASRRVDGIGPGWHTVALGARINLPSGVYVVRLSQDGRSLTTRAAVVR